jgi:hypothetical protein
VVWVGTNCPDLPLTSPTVEFSTLKSGLTG